MYEQGRMAQVIAEVTHYKLVILSISGSEWTKSDRMKTTTGETVLYSGREDDSQHEGFAIIMKKGVAKYLIEWWPVNRRTKKAQNTKYTARTSDYLLFKIILSGYMRVKT